MSYNDDLKKVLQLLKNKQYTYSADEDENYLRQKGRTLKAAAAKADDAVAKAVGSTANFKNSYGRAAAAFLKKSAETDNEDLKRSMEQSAKLAFDKEVTALQKQADSLQKKVDAENQKAAAAAAKAAGKSSASSKKSSTSASKTNTSTAAKETAWNKNNPDFAKIVQGSNKVYSTAYIDARKQTKNVSRSQEEGLRAQGEYIYAQCGKDYTKAMAVAKAVGLSEKYIQRASDMGYYDRY